MSLWRWANWLPDVPAEHRISLGEGATPLVRSRRIGLSAGLANLFFKLELTNPSGSYKDRFAAVGVSRLLADGKRRCVATSSGNAGAALAAYCAAADIECIVAAIETTLPHKAAQMLAHGAKVFRVRGFGIDPVISQQVLDTLGRIGSRGQTQLLISAYAISPIAMAGVQTISYELAEQAQDLGLALRHIFSPAGGGGFTLAIARGFEVAAGAGQLSQAPRVHCVQPAGNDTIASPLSQGQATAQAVQCTTQISGLQVPVVIDGNEVIAACRATGGTGYLVDDESVWAAQQRMAREEGIFCEPAAAVALAGALAAASQGQLAPDDPIVCMVTGSGFKDQAAVGRMTGGGETPEIDLRGLVASLEK